MPLQLDENVKALGSRAQAQLTEQFARIDAIAQENTARVLAAFQEHRVAESYFSGTTGYGYDDLGRDKLEYHLADFKKRSDSLSKAEQDTLRDMRIVQEMYARGYDFMPIDIYRAQADRFQVIDGKLMPSLSSIAGLGLNAAEGVVYAAKDGPFLSREDFRVRTKVSKTICDLMSDLGLLGDLPESNQLSLFDF